MRQERTAKVRSAASKRPARSKRPGGWLMRDELDGALVSISSAHDEIAAVRAASEVARRVLKPVKRLEQITQTVGAAA